MRLDISVEVSDPSRLAEQLMIEADGLERRFTHATPDANVRTTISEIRTIARAVAASAGLTERTPR